MRDLPYEGVARRRDLAVSLHYQGILVVRDRVEADRVSDMQQLWRLPFGSEPELTDYDFVNSLMATDLTVRR